MNARSRVLRSLGVVLVVGALFSTAACTRKTADEVGGDNRAKTTRTTAADSTDTDRSEPDDTDDSGSTRRDIPDGRSIGETVTMENWEITVTKVVDPQEPANDFLTPDEGNRWIAVDYTVKNISDKTAPLSSLFCFDLIDNKDNEYGMSIYAQDGDRMGDSELAPGQTIDASISFEIPDDASGLVLRFSCVVQDPDETFIFLDFGPNSGT